MTFTREEAIQYLVNSNIEDLKTELANNDLSFITSILRDGYAGFDDCSNKELEVAIWEAREGLNDDEIVVNG